MARIWLALWLVLLLSLLGSIFPASPVSASSDEVEWSRVNIPAEGTKGGWVLAKGADARLLTRAVDGTLYCYATPAGTKYTLFKSTDGGYSWSYTGKVNDGIVDIATAPDDADLVYYATSSSVYRSANAGGSFEPVAINPGGAGSNNVEITSIDVAFVGSGHIIAIGTRDRDKSQYGGIYILDESESFTLIDSNLGSYDACEIAFSPDFITDRQLIAVVTNEKDTIVTTKVSNAGWGENIGNAIIGGLVPVSASVAFPDGYSSDVTTRQHVQFVAIDAGSAGGDVYKVEGIEAPANSKVTDLNIGSVYGLDSVGVCGLAVSGNADTANLLAGAAGDAQVYISTNGGIKWGRPFKPPTGGSKTFVLMALDFNSSGRAYVATSGDESAFSISQDSGVTWNQIGLIDTGISDIVDVAVSPVYSKDSTMFMLTFGGKHSLWRSLNGGIRWERVYSSAPSHVKQINMIELSPQYGSSQVIFMAGASTDSPVIWKSADNGQKFLRLAASDPNTSTPFNIDTWAVADDKTLFVGSYDKSNGLVYRSSSSGLFYSTRAVTGSKSLSSIALSPNYKEDETILVGNSYGWVYWSDDNGVSFEPLPSDATSPSLTGSIFVAFDPDYDRNKTVYAASAEENEGIYRFIVGKSSEWESIDSTLPDGGMLGQLVTSADGVLYAVNSQKVDTAGKKGGIERCLDPTYSLGPKFETVIRGLANGATLTGLWRSGNRLWSVDSTNVRLLTYNDSLTLPVKLTLPPDEAPGIDTKDVKIKWEALKGATSYKWELDYDTDFSSIPDEFGDDTKATTARLPKLELDTTYYWRVRATEPVLSPWSAKWSFTTGLGSEVVTVKLISPEAGESGMPLKPILQWSVIAGADGYELLVSTESSFISPIIVKIGDYALSSTAWRCDINLDYDTTYYWKVRAINSDTYSAWSAVGAFTTESPPEPASVASPTSKAPALPDSSPKQSPSVSSSSPSESASVQSPPASSPMPTPSVLSPTPPPSSPQTAPYWAKWLMYLGIGLLLILLAMLLTMMILTVRLFRL